MTKKIDETRNLYEIIGELKYKGTLTSTDDVVAEILTDIGLSLARITDALEKLSEVEE